MLGMRLRKILTFPAGPAGRREKEQNILYLLLSWVRGARRKENQVAEQGWGVGAMTGSSGNLLASRKLRTSICPPQDLIP